MTASDDLISSLLIDDGEQLRFVIFTEDSVNFHTPNFGFFHLRLSACLCEAILLALQGARCIDTTYSH